MSLFEKHPCANVTPPTVLSYTTASISIFISIVATIGNSLVLLAVLIDPNRNLRSPFNWFVANLALADVLVGMVAAPLSAVFHISEGLKTSLHLKIENFLYFSYFIACTASLLSLIILAVDRYVAITFPLLYVVKVNSIKAFATLACAWVTSFILSLVYFKVGLNIIVSSSPTQPLSSRSSFSSSPTRKFSAPSDLKFASGTNCTTTRPRTWLKGKL